MLTRRFALPLLCFTQVTRDEIESVVREVLDKTLQPVAAYNHSKVAEHNSQLVDAVVKRLGTLDKPYKFTGTSSAGSRLSLHLHSVHTRPKNYVPDRCAVTSTILEHSTAGLHTAHGALWDSGNDLAVFVRWENKALYAMVVVCALKL